MIDKWNGREQQIHHQELGNGISHRCDVFLFLLYFFIFKLDIIYFQILA